MVCLGPICLPLPHLLILIFVLFRLVYDIWRPKTGALADSGPLISSRYEGLEGQILRRTQTERGEISPIKHCNSLGEIQNFLNTSSYSAKHMYPEHNRFVLIKYGAEWCGPCRQIQPFIETLRYCYKIAIILVDVDTASAELKSVASALPTFQLMSWPKNQLLDKAKPMLGLMQVPEGIIQGANKPRLESLIAKYAGTFIAPATPQTPSA